MDSKFYIDEYGTKIWKNSSGLLHREDGPAVECTDGTKEWFIEGKRHCTNGPAVEFANGNKKWYFEGKLHRINGPAIEYANGTKEWWLYGAKQEPPANITSYQSNYEKIIADGF